MSETARPAPGPTTTTDDGAGADVAALDASTLRLERRLPGPIERVWAYLVDPELRGTWLARGPLEGRVGGAVTLRFRHGELSTEQEEVPERYRAVHEAGHVMHGTVTAWDPPRRLRYTWDDEDEGSEVTFDLEPDGDDVLLTLTHRRLEGRSAMVSVSGGWHTHVEILRMRLEGREPRPFWGAHAAVEAVYRERLAGLPERTVPEGAPHLLAADDGRPLLRFTRRYDVPHERVWRAITSPEEVDRWYPAELRFEARVGGWVRERFPGHDIVLPEGRVVAFDPPERFAYDLQADPSSEEPSVRHPQRIDLTVREAPVGSVLRFEHVFADRAMAADFAAGWHVCLEQLGELLTGRQPQAPPDVPQLRERYGAWFGGRA